jgi:HPt (histidine-containing phosphotransfer) domain-containing protein
MDSGMNDFIAKPIVPKKLIITLAQWIEPNETRVAEHSNADELPIFDLGNILEMLGNNQTRVNQLLLTFMESIANLPDEIAAMISVNDYVSALKLVHTIKGTSGNIGALRLYAAAETLETDLQEGQVETVRFNIFLAAFHETMSAISVPPPEQLMALGGSGNTEAFTYAATELDNMLKGNDFISDAMLNTLVPHLADDQQDLFVQLCKLISNLHYGDARRILRQLAELSDIQETK